MIKRLVQKFLSRSALSILPVLERLVGRASFGRIQQATPDVRDLPNAVAEFLGVSEEFVMEQAAQATGLPLLKRIPLVECSSCTEVDVLRQYLQKGVVPLGGVVTCRAIVCVDPALAHEIIASYNGLPVYLGTWSQICQAASAAAQTAPSETQLRLAASGSLVEIIRVCEENLAHECAIAQLEGQLVYEFCSGQGKVGQGVVHRRVSAALKEYLSSLTPSACALRRKDGTLVHLEGIEFGVQQFKVRLRWKPPVSALIEDKSGRNNVIPFVRDEPQPLLEQIHKAEPIKRQVLIVDDNSTFSKVLERFLQRFDVEICIANRPQDALSLLKSGSNANPDLVICDLHMPGMSGSEFVQALRSDAKARSIPVIVLTSDSDIETELRLLGGGADVFVSKSADPRLLAVHVEKLLEKLGPGSAAA